MKNGARQGWFWQEGEMPQEAVVDVAPLTPPPPPREDRHRVERRSWRAPYDSTHSS
jgi:hypothetical protein